MDCLRQYSRGFGACWLTRAFPLPVIVGTIAALGTFLFVTWYRDRQAEAGKAWAKNEIYRRLPLACIASPW